MIAILSLFAFQSLNLDCDPSPLKRVNEFNDEGYWNHAARCKVLFDTFVPDEFNQGVIASPLFTLIQWGVFTVRGVSIHSARLLPLVSLWLTILMVYFLVRRASAASTALLAAAMLGFLHEMLTFTKWSTPIITETCLVVAVFCLLELARTRGRWWAAVAAGAFVAAVLTTTLSLHCLAGILLFLAVMLFVRKEVDWRLIGIFVATGASLAILVAVGYFLPIHEQLRVFLSTIGNDNLGGASYLYASDSSGPAPETRLITLFFEPFSSPGMVPLMMILSLWLIDLIARLFKTGVRPVLMEMSSLELFCVCWLCGAFPTLAATPYMPARRFVIFFAPIVVLASLFTRRVWTPRSENQTTQPSPADNLTQGSWRVVLWCAVLGVWGEYVIRSLTVLNSRWLNWTSFNISADPVDFFCIELLVFAIVAVVSGVYLSRRTKLAMAILLIFFAVVNVGLDLVWSLNATYTIRDRSRELARYTTPGEYFIDGWSWELSLENQCLPIFSPWYCYGKGINVWFAEESERANFLLCRTQEFEGYPIRQDTLPYPFPVKCLAAMPEVRVCPVVFAPQRYRYVAKLYDVRHAPPEKP